MRVAIAQFGPTTDTTANLAAIDRLTAHAAADSADVIVFPEEAMLSVDGLDHRLSELVDLQWPLFEAHLSGLAASHDIAIIAGGYEPNGTSRPNNTLVAVDSGGDILTRYRKLHLYDAFAYRESDYVTPGPTLPPVVDLAGLRIGLVNCYDLRFPELTRHLISQGAELISVSAAWMSGHRKADHWETLVRARAIENTVWVAAAGTISSACIGDSLVVDPLGVVKAALGDEPEAVVTVEISTARTQAVRTVLPALDNRRIELTMTVTS
ncbi:carbon-nitrogen hydrolase [Mycolicibacterium wolinskyi]|uniref:Carbon-nitrogen hydrolase n=1 Tax=Mycolicibacterium wolinskyi TaxID=59750 RepID=A0A132PU90_9MYCO|nr:carbon-nitrogen hydrolase family protein [Mycolicibacterium wolinskyi]KWX25906.1 carbon-nitrogen hydrolase [Mycolicibacterium wolinskyi]